MAFLELKNIGKIYASEGAVAVGIRGVNASFERGEFVAVTGESGSGKSTLLNVISGMDTYEEGELLIEGQPTSHFLQPDWEEYRKKYISFIFQDYNIIESFTVLQNVELSLMHIKSGVERRRRALELLDRVGMSDHAGHKGSKLSGGQKQRTVIARALAKDSPIILADEPTGNLDAASSREIMALLSEVSKDKLVIVVTHSFDESEQYATRHIRIYDGAVATDTELKGHAECASAVPEPEKESFAGNLSNGFSLGWAIFRSKPLLSLFICFLLLIGTFAVLGLSSASTAALQLFEKKYVFTPVEGRVVVARRDGRALSDGEITELAEKTGSVSYVRYDEIFDVRGTVGSPGDETYEIISNCKIMPPGTSVRPSAGRMPEERDEILLVIPVSASVGRFSVGGFEPFYSTVFGVEFRVVGIKTFRDNRRDPEIITSESGFEYLSAACFGNMSLTLRASVEGGKVFSSVRPSRYLKDDEVFFAGKADNKSYSVRLYGEAMYDNGSRTATDGTQDLNYVDLTSKISPEFDPPLYIGVDRYVEIFREMTGGENGYPQLSFLYSSGRDANRAVSLITNDDFVAVNSNTEREMTVLDIVEALIGGFFSAVMWVLGVIFISFFINLCTSRTIDAFRSEMAVMRSMGIPVRVIRIGMFFRMFISAIPAVVISLAALTIIFSVPDLSASFAYVTPATFALVTVGMIIIVARVTVRHVRRLFGESVKKAIRSGR
ncbi:MAG: ABC transporter ATP-binding protein/permease [Clostridia bacterium]|nr:ABC transporter ATP-binding protein/permease [Clostridia bacterium]